MSYSNSLKFLQEHSYLHDSIIDKIEMTNSTFVDDNGSIVFKKRGWNDIQIYLTSQNNYKIKITLVEVKRLNIHEFHEIIIFECKLEKKGNKILFSPTGDFGNNHIWFEAKDIKIEYGKK